MAEFLALKNAADNITGATIQQKDVEDRRKTIPKYFITIMGTTISPVLDYDKMNHFLLGFLRAQERFQKATGQ